MATDPSPSPRRPCAGSAGKKRTCWAREGTDWCRNHDPAEAERRRRAGSTRHPRFSKARLVGTEVFDASKVPTIAKVLDYVANIVDSVKDGSLEPKLGAVCLIGLRLMRDTLYDEREYEDRLKFAWEHQGSLRDAREREHDGDGGSTHSASDAPAVVVPPWMRLKPSTPKDSPSQ
jgi:hypothetical protein